MCEVETNNASSRTDGKMMTLKNFEPSFPIDPRIFFFLVSSSLMLIWPQALRHYKSMPTVVESKATYQPKKKRKDFPFTISDHVSRFIVIT